MTQQEKYGRNILKEKKNIWPMSMRNEARIYHQAKTKYQYIKKMTKNGSGKNRINTEISHIVVCD